LTLGGAKWFHCPSLVAANVIRDGKSLAAARGADVILSTSSSTKAMVDSIQGLRPDGRFVAMGADAEPQTCRERMWNENSQAGLYS